MVRCMQIRNDHSVLGTTSDVLVNLLICIIMLAWLAVCVEDCSVGRSSILTITSEDNRVTGRRLTLIGIIILLRSRSQFPQHSFTISMRNPARLKTRLWLARVANGGGNTADHSSTGAHSPHPLLLTHYQPCSCASMAPKEADAR